MTLSQLIERLEGAAGPSRELDRAIYDAVEWLQRPEDEPPAYTASVDAALTLVPEGWTALECRSHGNFARWTVEISRIDNTGNYEEAQIGRHATWPIALTIAALKARQTI